MDEERESLYTLYEEDEEGVARPIAYAYGAPWVAQALLMNDIKFDTPAEAKAWWEKNYGGKK